MSKEYYVSLIGADFYVQRPSGGTLTRAASVDNAKHICAELNQLLHRIPTHKYGPGRKFRKGDSVSPCFWDERPPTAYDINEITAHFMPEDGLYTVNKDELPDSTVLVEYKGKIITMQACHLELITPVEELEPYSVKLCQELTADDTYAYCAVVDDDGNEAARFYCEFYEEGKARAAAQAECDRLNAQYRKEMEK